ncbi:MAG: imidazole glycerol phosphate synthase subunit HisH [Bacteroidales bacterium]|jgi:glutamine amidotransferase|nr:imidazole glycerol phosphate synthase subunit HisH [Bacteroidales bacterium]
MNIVIIKYNSGNIFSVDYALRRLGIRAEITGDHRKIKSADKVIFPGVGEASTTMRYLCEHGLNSLIRGLQQPVLGICLGLQLMCSRSEEGDTACLNIFDEEVVRFRPPDGIKVPHMGWNSLQNMQSPLFDGLPADPYVYFVHSYYAPIGTHTIAVTSYSGTFSAALRRDNFFALQFHPEKSGEAGALILKNFIEKIG